MSRPSNDWLTRLGFRYEYDAKRDEYRHGSGIMMLTPDGRLSRYFYGIDFPARELRFGLEDSSAGKIGSPIATPLRLLCFSYDPATGKYTLMTMQFLRAGAVLTVLVLCVFWLRAWRRGRCQADLSLNHAAQASGGVL